MQLHISSTAWKNSQFVLWKRSDVYMVINLSKVVRALPIHMLTSLLVDEMLLLR